MEGSSQAGVASTPATDVLREALLWASRGRPVFPLLPGRKQPAVPWSTEATTDARYLRAWFDPENPARQTAAYPPSKPFGLGLPTGDGLVVVDVDLAKGATIPEWLPGTYTVRTQSGGLHYYYLVDGEVPNSANKLGENIDVRGDGGYVVAPPTPGYRILVNVPIARLDKLRLTAVQRELGVFEQPVFEFPPNHTDKDGNIVVDDPIGEGERNDWLFRACGHAREHGIDDEGTLLVWAMAANELYIDPPLDEGEVAHVVRSSLRYLGS